MLQGRLLSVHASETRTDEAVATSQLDGRVAIEAWDDRGRAFEFAHYSPRQIARAIIALGKTPADHDKRALTAKLRVACGPPAPTSRTLGCGERRRSPSLNWPWSGRRESEDASVSACTLDVPPAAIGWLSLGSTTIFLVSCPWTR